MYILYLLYLFLKGKEGMLVRCCVPGAGYVCYAIEAFAVISFCLLQLKQSITDLFQFKQISQAYEVLSNPEKRKIYDQGGEQAIKEGGIGSHNGMSSPMDIFDMFFGGGTRKRDNRSANVVHQLNVTLEELYNGAVRKLAVQKNVICDTCEGKTIKHFIFNFQNS